jgi:hypothetical protein
MIEEETRWQAAVALKNAFWHDFSALCNAYLAAGADLLEQDNFDYQLSDMTSLFGRDTEAKPSPKVDIHVAESTGRLRTFTTIEQALAHKLAVSVYIGNTKVFERWGHDGPWTYIES